MTTASERAKSILGKIDREIDFKQRLEKRVSPIKTAEGVLIPKKRDVIQTEVDKAIAKGVDIAKRLKEEMARMIEAYNHFVEERLLAVIVALGCRAEDLTLETREQLEEYEPGKYKSIQILYKDEIPLLRFERIMIDGQNTEFYAIPISEEE